MKYRAARLFLALAALPLVVSAPSAWAQAPQTPPPAQPPQTPTPPPPPQDERPRPRFRIGPEVGVYIPTDSKTRDAFGNSWFNYGIALSGIQSADAKGRFGFDLGFISARRSGSEGGRVFMAPIGVSYRRRIDGSVAARPVIPYVGASANLIITDLKSDKYDVDGGVRAAGGGSVFVGATFSQSAYIQARYFGVSKVKGFNLSGWNLSAGYRF